MTRPALECMPIKDLRSVAAMRNMKIGGLDRPGLIRAILTDIENRRTVGIGKPILSPEAL